MREEIVTEQVETARAESSPPAAADREKDRERTERLLQDLRDQQNLPLGILAGGLAALAGAVLWGLVTAFTHYQIGWMALGVGCLVGLAVRKAGKGIEQTFGLAGGALAFLGCLAGNVLVVYLMVGPLPPEKVCAILVRSFTPIDLLFYGLAVYEGYRFSFRRLSRAELESLASR